MYKLDILLETYVQIGHTDCTAILAKYVNDEVDVISLTKVELPFTISHYV